MTPRNVQDKGCGCPDHQRTTLSRRTLLRSAGVVGAAGLAAPCCRPRWRWPHPDYTGDTLIVLSMRGGFDGLSAVVPYGDPALVGLRTPGKTQVPPGKLLADTDGYFGLHPSFAPLMPYWTAGTFGVVHGLRALGP